MNDTLRQFAGDDRPARKKRKPSADSLFRMGCDTVQIAKILGCDEAEALKRLSIERSNRLNLRWPYAPKSKNSQEVAA